MKNRRTFLKDASLLSLGIPLSVTEWNADAAESKKAQIEITGDWQIRVLVGIFIQGKTRLRVAQTQTFEVSPATLLHVRDEKHDSLPLFDANAAPWDRGAKLRQLITAETTAAGSLVPESLVLKSGQGDAMHYTAGKDYAVESTWATTGRLPNGNIPENAPVWMDYDCGWGRIDTLVVNKKGVVALHLGPAHNATPQPTALGKDETALANLWIPARLPKLTPDSLYPIVEPVYPEPKHQEPPAAKLLPKTWAKLQAGQPLHVLAWGDSVTAGGGQFVSLPVSYGLIALVSVSGPLGNVARQTLTRPWPKHACASIGGGGGVSITAPSIDGATAASIAGGGTEPSRGSSAGLDPKPHPASASTKISCFTRGT